MPRRKAYGPLRPLFLDDNQLAAILLPNGQVDDWKGIAAVLEREGFPSIDPLLGGRYLPAIRRFFDNRYGISNEQDATRPDGSETW